MVTIKKADGTTEKITLAEFRSRKQTTENRPASSAGRQQTTVNRQQRRDNGPRPQTSAPKFNQDDAKSLLDEPTLAPQGNLPPVSDQRWPQVETIIKKINFPVANQKRLRGLIQLRLKDVRGEDETRDWLARPADKGGLGLTPLQAEEILKLCRQSGGGRGAEIQPLKRPVGQSAPMTTPPTPPLAKGGTAAEPLSAPMPKPILPVAVRPNIPPARPTSFTPKTTMPQFRHPVRDVAPAPVQSAAPSRSVNVGPTEEIRILTLTDFRRLSANPTEAAARLKQKFANLKTESYLLFIDALAAWRQSPLYLEYVGKVANALNAGRKLADVLEDKSKIQLNEITALMEMEKGL